jgi:ABC-type multidrug transport system fused ATPase/permease subunit
VISDSPDARAIEAVQGRVAFEAVSFRYGKGAEVLHSIDFSAEPGETIALVGTSGAGKSTLLSLLLRFYDPTSGRVCVDGHDLHDVTLSSLRSFVTIVFQSPMLLRRSIRDNIAFGRDGATNEDIIDAAKLAEAHEFIEALPKGYDTLVMERGGNLSGGQQQRISIARAILRDTPIVILDEPTTGLDAVSEAQVNEAINHLSHGRTTFVIAHSFSSLRNADRILVLEGGEIAAQGNHRELMESSALYKKLFDLQFSGDGSAGIIGLQAEPEGTN